MAKMRLGSELKLLVSTIALCCIFFVLPKLAFTQESLCDESIRGIDSALGYHLREDRCEGIYEANLSSHIELLSAVNMNCVKLGTTYRTLKLIVPSIMDKDSVPVLIRITVLRMRTHYQMDTRCYPGTIFLWDTKEVLEKTEIPLDQLGFLSWYNRGKDKIYIPLVVNALNGTLGTDRGYTIVVRAPLSTEWIAWRCYPLEIEPAESQMEWKHFERGNVGAGQPIPLQIKLKSSGLYAVEIRAKAINRNKLLSLYFRILV